MTKIEFIPLEKYRQYTVDEMLKRSQGFYDDIKRRRTVRDFSNKPVPREVIENCIKAAGTAPSGANLQPWHFVVVSNPEIKRKLELQLKKKKRNFTQIVHQKNGLKFWNH